DQPACHDGGDERHHPRDAEQAPLADLRLRQHFAGHAERPSRQIRRGSKLCEASMVSTTTQVKATRPGPGTTDAREPSLTSATSTASRKTSSIAHGPIASMNW